MKANNEGLVRAKEKWMRRKKSILLAEQKG